MDRQELPDYKQNFLREMQQLRQEQNRVQLPNYLPQNNLINRPVPQNNILNTSQYSSANWRNQLNQTQYKRQHNSNQHDLNLLMNPEIARKKHNINITQISEYSNAMHNNTVFVNPKHTSC